MRVTLRERIILHLLDFVKYADSVEVPKQMTQDGIALCAGIDLPHFAQYARPLVREGVVRDRMAHVEGARQRRKVYSLTESGRMAAIRLRERVRAEKIRVVGAEGVRETTISTVLDQMGGKLSPIEIVRQVAEDGVLDLVGREQPAGRVSVEMIADAPKIDFFVGRFAQLADLAEDKDRPRIFVVRGMAGIGKSSLAVKACERLRERWNLYWRRVRPWDTSQTLFAGLSEFLAALGRPGLQYSLTRGQVGRMPEVLRADIPGTRSFLVFDDADEGPRDVVAFFRLLCEVIAEAPDVRVLVLCRRSVPFYDRRDVVLKGLVREVELAGLSTEEVTSFLAAAGVERPQNGGKAFAGHPLFLELLRTHREIPSRALADMQRFLEESVYVSLSDAERSLMKLGSLYRVAVPRNALLAREGLTHDILSSLVDRALVRSVGDARYELHDTIRGFFENLLTPIERKEFGSLASDQLLALAKEAVAEADIVGCIGYLANAARLEVPAEKRLTLMESLADSYGRIGDLSAASTAYREAMRKTRDPEILAFLHRKLAWAYQTRGDNALASKEIVSGFRALGEQGSRERGWLRLVQCRIDTRRHLYERARIHAQEALDTFRAFGDHRGETEALLELGLVAAARGPKGTGEPISAEFYFRKALSLSQGLSDPELAARIRLAMIEFIAWRTGDYEQGMRHFGAIEALPGALANPALRARFFFDRSRFILTCRVDHQGAESDVLEALRIARQNHDAIAIADVRYGLGLVMKEEGRIEEARRQFERAEANFATAGRAGQALDALFRNGECCLLLSDIRGFNRVVGSLTEPILQEAFPARIFRADILRALHSLILGDGEGCENRFGMAFDGLRKFPAESRVAVVEGWLTEYYCGIALAAMGRGVEGETRIRRVLETLEARRNYGVVAGRAQAAPGLVKVLGDAYRAAL